MANVEKLSIGVVAELKDFEAKMAELPGIGAKEARDMVKGIQRSLKEADKSAKKTGDTIKNEVGGGLEEVGSTADWLKGKFNETFGVAGEAITEVLGPLGSAATGLQGIGAAGIAAGVGVGAAVVAVGGLLFATNSLAAAAVEVRDRLIEQGKASQIPPEAMQSLNLYSESQTQLKEATDQLILTLGGEFADDLAVIISRTADLVLWTSSAASSLQEFNDSAISIISLGIASYFIDWRDAVADVEKATIEAEAAQRKWEQSTFNAAVALGEKQAALDSEAESQKRAAAAQRARAEAEKELAAEQAKAHSAYVAAVEFQTAQTLANATVRVEQSKAVEDQIESERQTYLQGFRDVNAASREQLAFEEEKANALRDVWAGVANNTLSAFGTVADSIVAGYERRASAGEELTQKERAAASLAYGLSQSFAAGQAIIQAAVATIGMAAQLAPFIGPAAPGVAAIAGGAMLAAALTSIATAPAPEFPMGVSPDHQLVGKRPDEGIANARAMRALGGPDGLDRLNGGGGLPSADGPQTVALLREIRDLLRPSRGPSILRAVAGNKPR